MYVTPRDADASPPGWPIEADWPAAILDDTVLRCARASRPERDLDIAGSFFRVSAEQYTSGKDAIIRGVAVGRQPLLMAEVGKWDAWPSSGVDESTDDGQGRANSATKDRRRREISGARWRSPPGRAVRALLNASLGFATVTRAAAAVAGSLGFENNCTKCAVGEAHSWRDLSGTELTRREESAARFGGHAMDTVRRGREPDCRRQSAGSSRLATSTNRRSGNVLTDWPVLAWAVSDIWRESGTCACSAASPTHGAFTLLPRISGKEDVRGTGLRPRRAPRKVREGGGSRIASQRGDSPFLGEEKVAERNLRPVRRASNARHTGEGASVRLGLFPRVYEKYKDLPA